MAAPAQDVRDKLRTARERLDAGAPVRDASRTVADWLAQWRATTLAVSDRKPSTREMYAHLCRKHLEPAPFGAITAGPAASPPTSRLWCSTMQGPTGRRTRRSRSVYTVLRPAWTVRCVTGCWRATPPPWSSGRVWRAGRPDTLAAVDVTALLNAADGLRYRDVLVLIAATGMRRGEALALRWTDVDLDAGLLTVRGDPRAHRRQAGGVRTQDGPVTAHRAARRTVGGDAAPARTEQKAETTARRQPVAELGSGVHHRARDTGRAAQLPAVGRDGAAKAAGGWCRGAHAAPLGGGGLA